jgi:hypothetical protein
VKDAQEATLAGVQVSKAFAELQQLFDPLGQ